MGTTPARFCGQRCPGGVFDALEARCKYVDAVSLVLSGASDSFSTSRTPLEPGFSTRIYIIATLGLGQYMRGAHWYHE